MTTDTIAAQIPKILEATNLTITVMDGKELVHSWNVSHHQLLVELLEAFRCEQVQKIDWYSDDTLTLIIQC